MPPKQQNPTVTKTAKGKKPMAKLTPGQAPVKQKNASVWWVFTKVSSTFVERAKVLANLLTSKYGEGVSISQFERMLEELDNMPPQHVKLLDLSREHLVAYQEYLDAKKVRDAERESFLSRGTYAPSSHGWQKPPNSSILLAGKKRRQSRMKDDFSESRSFEERASVLENEDIIYTVGQNGNFGTVITQDINVKNQRKKTYFVAKQFANRHAPPDKHQNLPDMGSEFGDAKELRKLSNMQMHFRRKQLLSFVKESRHDPQKREVMRDAAVGTLTRSDWIWQMQIPYITSHHRGFFFYWRKPGLTFFDQALTQLCHCYSTYLLKVEYIKLKYLEIERRRRMSILLRNNKPGYGPLI
jgi:hypothetical protein